MSKLKKLKKLVDKFGKESEAYAAGLEMNPFRDLDKFGSNRLAAYNTLMDALRELVGVEDVKQSLAVELCMIADEKEDAKSRKQFEDCVNACMEAAKKGDKSFRYLGDLNKGAQKLLTKEQFDLQDFGEGVASSWEISWNKVILG